MTDAPTEAAEPQARPSHERREQRRLEAARRQARHRELLSHREIVQRLENEIVTLERRQAELTADLERPETYAQPGRAVAVNSELKALLDRLPALMQEWENAATALAQLEAESCRPADAPGERAPAA